MPYCPGQDKRFWKPGDIFEIPCSGCGAPVEFFKDEPKRACRKCGKSLLNPRINLGCAQWCPHAVECVGVSVIESREVAVRDHLINDMKKVFNGDERRINHAMEVLCHAEEILETENADPLVVKAAAILHDIGIPAAERKHGSSGNDYQENEGPPITRAILDRLGVDKNRISHICCIVENHHSARDIDTVEFRIIWDADHLVNMAYEIGELSSDEKERYVKDVFKTRKGCELAQKQLITSSPFKGEE